MAKQRRPAKSEDKRSRRKWAAPTENPRTPRATEQRVFALALAGNNKSKIAEEVGINRETVARILSQQEFNSLVDQLRCRIITEIGHEAVSGLLKLVKKNDRVAILQTLFGLKVLSQHTSLELQGGKLPERTYDDAKFQFYYKFGRWPSLQEAAAPFPLLISLSPSPTDRGPRSTQSSQVHYSDGIHHQDGRRFGKTSECSGLAVCIKSSSSNAS